MPLWTIVVQKDETGTQQEIGQVNIFKITRKL